MATSIKIDDDLRARIRSLAQRRRRSSHWIMREAIEQYVAREEARESFKQEAYASWSAYQETGRHLTGDEVRDWLGRWGSCQTPGTLFTRLLSGGMTERRETRDEGREGQRCDSHFHVSSLGLVAAMGGRHFEPGVPFSPQPSAW